MFTPEFWKNENKIGNALYRINQSQYKDYCEIDELFVFLAQEYPEQRELFETLYAEYAEYVEEQSRLRIILIILLFIFAFCIVGQMDPYTNGCLV